MTILRNQIFSNRFFNKMRRISLTFLISIAAIRNESFEYEITFDANNATSFFKRTRELTELFKNDDDKEIVTDCNDDNQPECCKTYLVIWRNQLDETNVLNPLQSNRNRRFKDIPIKIVISDSLITQISQLAEKLEDKNSSIYIWTRKAIENHIKAKNIPFGLQKMVKITGIIGKTVNKSYDGRCQSPITGFVTCFYLSIENSGVSKVQINIFFDIVATTITTTTTTTTTSNTTTSLPAPTKKPICKYIWTNLDGDV